MKKLFSNAVLFWIIALAFAPFTHAQISNPKIYIAPQNGFESYLAGAFTKKSVPAQMVQTEEAADYILSPAPDVISRFLCLNHLRRHTLFRKCASKIRFKPILRSDVDFGVGNLRVSKWGECECDYPE